MLDLFLNGCFDRNCRVGLDTGTILYILKLSSDSNINMFSVVRKFVLGWGLFFTFAVAFKEILMFALHGLLVLF